MRNDTPTDPPLRRYLNRYSMTVAEFHRRFEAASGSRISDVAVSYWARGTSSPRPHHQLTIQQITRGEVTVLDWAEWQAAQQRESHHG